MDVHEKVLKIILEKPGTSKEFLSRLFSLSGYRLNRVLRKIERDLSGRTIVHSEKNGLWLVDLNPEKCLGIVWQGEDPGGYRQCALRPSFRDGRCYDHSEYENPEIVAFRRRLEYLVGPSEPSAYYVGQLNMTEVEELLKRLLAIAPLTRNDGIVKGKYLKMLKSGLAFLKWKDRMRRRRDQDWIPPEFFARHGRSSVNPFEFSLKKCFVTLQVSVDATKEEVLRSWRKLARKYHPDTREGDEERMKTINLAKDKIFRIKRWD